MTTATAHRRDAILAQAYERGHVAVKDLAEALDVSVATVRRDLRGLAEEGRLELTYGGAVVVRNSDFSFRSKSRRNVGEKRAIGRAASELVADGEQIFVDSGTTCLEMAPYLRRKRGVSVIVNSVRLAAELDAPGLSVIVLGGEYRPDRLDTVGPVAIDALERLRGYLAFIGTDGLGMDFGLTASDMESAFLHRTAIRNAREAILLADHTKFEAPSLHKIVDWEAVSRVVTDRAPTGDWAGFLNEKGVEVVCCNAAPAEEGTR